MTPFEAGIHWLLALVSGPVITTLLTLSIAFVALGMLFGHVSFRRAGQVVLGSFILVGSAEIAQSLIELIPRENEQLIVPERHAPARILPDAPLAPARDGNPFDPYAGSPHQG